jgi:hypothetical protein
MISRDTAFDGAEVGGVGGQTDHRQPIGMRIDEGMYPRRTDAQHRATRTGFYLCSSGWA